MHLLIMKKLIMLFLLQGFILALVHSQTQHNWSLFAGGLSDFKEGAFLYGGGEYNLNRHLSANLTLHRDDTREKWDDGSKGYYVAYAPSVSARLSWFPNGRGAFVQAGACLTSASLKVTEAGGTVKKASESAWAGNWKLGYRWSPHWGRKPTGFFVEAVLNYTVSFTDFIVETDPAPAGTETPRPTLDWHSWNIYKGDVGSTFLIGVGYTW